MPGGIRDGRVQLRQSVVARNVEPAREGHGRQVRDRSDSGPHRLRLVAVRAGSTCPRVRWHWSPAQSTTALPALPDLPPDVVIQVGQRCETVQGKPLDLAMRLGVRSWGHAPDASNVLLTGTYEQHSAIGEDLLGSLPSPVVGQRPTDDRLVALLAEELTADAPGQQSLLDRLVDALVIDTIRRWYADQPTVAPAWWHGHHDPVVGEALRLIHDEPHRPWTIATLARTVGTSRANLARRFGGVVGEPVITYLTRWRLSLAADLITQPGQSVTSVADQVGYGSPFALSTAFKRRYGLSPHQHRIAALAALEQSTG